MGKLHGVATPTSSPPSPPNPEFPSSMDSSLNQSALAALRAMLAVQRQEPRSPFVFTSECGTPFTTAGFARMIERVGVEADFGFKAHPHMLRHACGHELANKGHDTRALQAHLGHRNIQHTVRYTELSPVRFKDFRRN